MDQPVSDLGFLPKRTLGRSNGPLYRQLADIVARAYSAMEHFPVGGELPKEAVIAEHFGVSLITVGRRCVTLRPMASSGSARQSRRVVTARNPSVNLSWKFKNFADMAAFTKDAHSW